MIRCTRLMCRALARTGMVGAINHSGIPFRRQHATVQAALPATVDSDAQYAQAFAPTAAAAAQPGVLGQDHQAGGGEVEEISSACARRLALRVRQYPAPRTIPIRPRRSAQMVA